MATSASSSNDPNVGVRTFFLVSLISTVAVSCGGNSPSTQDSPAAERTRQTAPPAPAAPKLESPSSTPQPREAPTAPAADAATAVVNAPAAFAVATAAKVGRYPVKWSARLELPSLDSVPQLLRTPSPLDFGDLELAGEVTHPALCSEWAELHARGFTAPSTMEEKSDDSAKERCEALVRLQHARPAQVSHVRNLPWDRRLLALLPPDIASHLDPEVRQRAGEAAAAGWTYKRFDPKAKAKRARDAESLEITEGNGNWSIFVYPLVWGDLNGDTIDDILLSIMSADRNGPMTSVRLLLATRTSADEPLRTIEWR